MQCARIAGWWLVSMVFGAVVVGQTPATPPVPDARIGSVSVRAGDDVLTMPTRLVEPDVIEPGASYPLVVFLHGAGERGTDGDSALRFFGPPMTSPRMRTEHPCFILAVQCPRDRAWTETGPRAENPTMTEQPTMSIRGVMAAIEQVLRDRPVDRRRIYLTGLSLGGYGAWDLAMRWPDTFAAVVPVCGGGDPTKADRLKDIPVQVWHGATDASVPVERGRAMVEALKKAGATVDYRELPRGGHDVWLDAYLPEAAIAFMFAQVRDAPAPTTHPVADPADRKPDAGGAAGAPK